MANLEKLKQMIDEENYPYFDDMYLQARIEEMGENVDLKLLARELCLQKAGIEEIKLGDITIPSPRNHFLMLASKYRSNMTGVTVRADGS
jgi:hypothetical protein